MRRSSRAALLAAVLSIAGPALAGEPDTFRCEARGGPAWREYRTAHFDVATDMGAARAEALVGNLEYLHALVVQAVVGDGVEIPGRVRVIAFASPREFALRTGSSDVKGFFGVGRFHTPIISLVGEGFHANEQTVAHELAHHVSRYLFARQPRWFSEGLAQFVQTVGRVRGETAAPLGSHVVRGDRDGGGRWAGGAPAELVEFLHVERGSMPLDLLAWVGRPGKGEGARYYAWSWLLYHWLWNTRPKEFSAFTARLSEAEDPASAWRAAFPDLDPTRPGALDELERKLDLYRRNGRFMRYAVKATPDTRFTVAPLPPAEVHVLLSEVRRRPLTDEQFRAEMEEALREQPHHPLAIAATVADLARRAEALRAAAAARPDDWRAWLLLGQALDREKEAAEKEAALRKAVALNAGGATARNELAWLLVHTGRAKEALPHANAALDLAPWSAAIVDTLAVTALELGKCREALVLAQRALALVPDEANEQRARLVETLARIEARCPAPAPPR